MSTVHSQIDLSDSVLMEHLAPLLTAASKIPVMLYDEVAEVTVRDLVRIAKQFVQVVEEPSLVANRSSSSKGQTSETTDLDSQVEKLVVKISAKNGEARMSDLTTKLPGVNDQRIRRALVRLRHAGRITAQGNTRVKCYRAAAAG